jgi:hypothetical protein
MARTLSDRDRDILARLAPDIKDLFCTGSEHEYRSILPPLANHISESQEDFIYRLSNLSDEDLSYLITAIENGQESLCCLNPEYSDAFLAFVEDRQGSSVARYLKQIMAFG